MTRPDKAACPVLLPEHVRAGAAAAHRGVELLEAGDFTAAASAFAEARRISNRLALDVAREHAKADAQERKRAELDRRRAERSARWSSALEGGE